eukprot:Hpha_TRINITY_DN27050_c0_g1::TRINITY_DN27050_c0_g1_i1::g.33351::m.33351
MSVLMIFAQVDAKCAGPAAGEGCVPVELDLMATAGDIIDKLRKGDVIQGLVEVQFSGKKLAPTAVLTDSGMCSESTVTIVHAQELERSLGIKLVGASEDGNADECRRLLDALAPVDSRHPEEDVPFCEGTALHIAANEGHVNVAEILLERGADIEAKNTSEATPLYVATLQGHTEVARLLLSKGAAVDSEAMIPLKAAIYEMHDDLIELLLDHGAVVDADIVEWAKQTGQDETVELLEKTIKKRGA